MAMRSVARGYSFQVDSRTDFAEYAQAVAHVLQFHGWDLVYNPLAPGPVMEARYAEMDKFRQRGIKDAKEKGIPVDDAPRGPVE